MPSPAETSEAPDEPGLSGPERDAAESSAQATEEPQEAGEAAAAADAELAEPGDAPERPLAGDQAALENGEPASEPELASPTTEEEAPTEAEEEAPMGDFSHQGTGPARSPMQEILATASDSQEVDQGSDKGLSEPDAADDRRQSTEPVGGEETEIMASATEPETADVSSPEAAEPEPDAGRADQEATRDQPAGVAPAAAAGQDIQPSAGQLVSWAMLALLVVIGFTLAVVNREAVVRNLPGSASFYGGLGLAVNLRGLDFENVKSTWTMEADQPVLEVSGEIVNITDGQMAVPMVVFALHDEDGVEVHRWQAEVTDKPLEAGGRTQFTARIPSPPASSKSVQVKFAEAQ
jgi:hypothetical protein